MKSGNAVTVNLSDNEACALSMLAGGIGRDEFESALQCWLDEHSRVIFPPGRNAGNNVVALCRSYVTSPRLDENTKATLFDAMGAAVAKLCQALADSGYDMSFKDDRVGRPPSGPPQRAAPPSGQSEISHSR
jgi:hypothetical protein